jgi:hypothetical protein
MGISDEDYANAIEHQRLHQRALMELEIQKMKEKQMSLSGQTSLASLAGSMGVGAIQPVSVASPQAGSILVSTGTSTTWANNVSMTQSGSKVLDVQDLKHDAMQAPLSALVDMWTVRYGGTWVDEADFVEDDFWRLALIRLVGANKLEKHHLASQYSAVYRIIE